jgi:hypothetical protein
MLLKYNDQKELYSGKMQPYCTYNFNCKKICCFWSFGMFNQSQIVLFQVLWECFFLMPRMISTNIIKGMMGVGKLFVILF